MSHDFDSAADAVITLVQEAEGFEGLRQAVLVRDVIGRLRLVWRPERGMNGPDALALGKRLQAEVGGWFRPPILSTDAGHPDERGVARVVLSQAEPWPDAWRMIRDPRTGGDVEVSPVWRLLSRRLSKDVWLAASPGNPPWPLRGDNPAIVAFHSFKGGVGRTTALATVAWHLARAGHRVVCVDLDLESPGLHAVLDVAPEAGVVDFLVAHQATGAAEPEVVTATVHGVEIEVVRAGRVDRSYAERLARLDLHAAGDETGAVATALRALLEQLKARGARYILLDNRSGLSDLAGVSLASDAHVDVLVARANRQGTEGLRLVSELLASRRRVKDRRTVVVHALAPLPVEGPAWQAETEQLRLASWHAFKGTFYDDEPPATEDATAPHVPIVLPSFDEIRAAERLGRVEPSTLASPHFERLAARVVELAEPEDGG